MFFTYYQNSSGGHFTYLPNLGISRDVIIEAESAAHANERAESLGLYFNGAGVYFGGDGDCDCCGDRWYAKWDDEEGDPVPSHYGDPIDLEGFAPKSIIKWIDGFEGFVHFADGTIKGFWPVEQKSLTG